MKIRQQKQIKAFLTEKYGESKGLRLFAERRNALAKLIESTFGKTENQMKTLTQTILPRIALYKTLPGAGLSQTEAYDCMRRYMLDVVAAKKHASTASPTGAEEERLHPHPDFGLRRRLLRLPFFQKAAARGINARTKSHPTRAAQNEYINNTAGGKFLRRYLSGENDCARQTIR